MAALSIISGRSGKLAGGSGKDQPGYQQKEQQARFRQPQDIWLWAQPTVQRFEQSRSAHDSDA